MRRWLISQAFLRKPGLAQRFASLELAIIARTRAAKSIAQLGTVLFGLLLLASCGKERKRPLLIATAASAQYAVEALTEAFTKETGLACRRVIASSGKLTAQIREGAPYDVFLAADTSYPARLHAEGYCGRPVIYGRGQLVLWTLDTSLELRLTALLRPEVKRIALANPRLAPYGAAARAGLEQLGHYRALEPKLVYGESIAQVNQFIGSRTVDGGFTAESVVRAPRQRGKGRWVRLDTMAFPAVDQGMVLLKGSKQPAAARAFFDFVASAAGREILASFGYH